MKVGDGRRPLAGSRKTNRLWSMRVNAKHMGNQTWNFRVQEITLIMRQQKHCFKDKGRELWVVIDNKQIPKSEASPATSN